MKNSSTISSKGQVTVPQEIRTRAGLSAGDRVEFVMDNGKILFRPLRGETNPRNRPVVLLGIDVPKDAIVQE